MKKISLLKIRINGGTQSRAQINDDTVADYAEAMTDGAQFPPVVVFHDGKDYWLADGFHRYHAANKAGIYEIQADICQGSQRDAILRSVGANAAHGLRRTNDDKRRAVMVMLNDFEWAGWNDREIARQCGVTHPFVGKLRKEVSGNDYQIEPRTVTRNGTTYEQNTANIGNGSKPDQEIPSERTNREDGATGREGYAPDGSSRLSAGRTADPSDTGETVEDGDEPAVGESPAPDQEPEPTHDPYGYSKLTEQALLDLANGLRAELDEAKALRQEAESKIEVMKEQIRDLSSGNQGLIISRLHKQIVTLKEQRADAVTKAAKETRRANFMEKERNELRKKWENQVIPL